MKKKLVLYITLFFLTCLIPFAGLLLGVESKNSTENRELSSLPQLFQDTGFNASYMKELGNYFEEHFALRQELVTANAKIMSGVFGESADDGVIVGTKGWLYYKDSLDDYQGTSPMTNRQLFDVAHTMSMIQTYAEKNNVKFLFAIAPNKNSLYGEQMPYYYQHYRTEEKNLDNIQPYLSMEKVHCVDLYRLLREKPNVLYHKTDSHWNNQGASLAANALLQNLEQTHRDYTGETTVKKGDFEGDLEAMLYPAAIQKEDEFYYEPDPDYQYVKEVESNFAPKINTTGSGKGSLVMYRDSFGNALLPFMAEAYENAYFSRGVPYQLSDLFTYKADTLVIERAERFLPEMAENPPVMPAPIVTSLELGEMDYFTEIRNLEISTQGNYTKITGEVPTERIKDNSRIFIRVDELLNYEAFPVSIGENQEGFELYLITDTLKDENFKIELGLK